MEVSEKLQRGEAERLGLESEIQTLRDTVTARKAESEREARKKERLEKELRESKA